MMGSVHVESDEILVSFDVSSLFTSASVDEAISVIRKRLREDETLGDRTILSPERVAELLEMCLKPTSAMEEASISRRKVRPMGSPVSAVVANLYMEFFEELALETAPTRPRLWKRYVRMLVTLSASSGRAQHKNSYTFSTRSGRPLSSL